MPYEDEERSIVKYLCLSPILHMYLEQNQSAGLVLELLGPYGVVWGR